MRAAMWAGQKGNGVVHALVSDDMDEFFARFSLCGMAGRFIDLDGAAPTRESCCVECIKREPELLRVAEPLPKAERLPRRPRQDEELFDGAEYERT